MTRTYQIGRLRFRITEDRRFPGCYIARLGKQLTRDYRSTPRTAHKAVLLTFLDDAGRAGVIDRVTAHWPERDIREIRRG